MSTQNVVGEWTVDTYGNRHIFLDRRHPAVKQIYVGNGKRPSASELIAHCTAKNRISLNSLTIGAGGGN